MKTNIALIGFMGAGKTSTGAVLARRLKKKFFEVDAQIEQKAGKTIPEIFGEDGEAAFRRLEMEITEDISKEENAVIACGGGIVLNKINIDRLKQNAVIIYLEVTPEIIVKRLMNSGVDRPLLNTPNRKTRINVLLEQRKPLYEQEADLKITIDKADDDIVKIIIKALEANESIDFQK